MLSSQVPHVLPSQPLQRFFVDFPGLTGFIGRIVLSYFDNTTTLNQGVKRKRHINEHGNQAARREAWRKRVHNTREPKTFNKTAPTRRSNRLAGRPPKPTKPTSAAAAASAVQRIKSIAHKYRGRDAHEIFFRPADEAAKKAAKVRGGKAAEKQKKKPKALTNKQRQAKALAHFIIHHIQSV